MIKKPKRLIGVYVNLKVGHWGCGYFFGPLNGKT